MVYVVPWFIGPDVLAPDHDSGPLKLAPLPPFVTAIAAATQQLASAATATADGVFAVDHRIAANVGVCRVLALAVHRSCACVRVYVKSITNNRKHMQQKQPKKFNTYTDEVFPVPVRTWLHSESRGAVRCELCMSCVRPNEEARSRKARKQKTAPHPEQLSFGWLAGVKR